MLPTEDLFVYVYTLIDDAIKAGAVAIPARPGPAPGCTDAEVLAVAMVRHLLGRRSEAGFLTEVARDWSHLFPVLPGQSEFNRRARWLWGAFEQVRVLLAARLPEDDCQQVDTSAIPVKHTSRVRGPDGWTGPNGLAARFGRDAAHAEWFYGFRVRRDKTGMEEEMKELHTEGLATHGDPESCVASREGRGEALTGARAGRAIEPRNQFSGVPTPSGRWKATLLAALARAVSGPRAVAEPGHVRNLHAREPGDLVPARRPDQRAGRSGNAVAVILR